MTSPNEGNSQTENILNWMLAGNSITAIEALERFQCFRLASRIGDIKSLNKYSVKREMITTKTSNKKVARYSISI